MSTYRLDRLFSPRSVALIGGSTRKYSVGGAVLRNLRQAGFGGAIGLVNPHHTTIEGITAVKSIDDLAVCPDLAIIATPPPIVPELIAGLGSAGCAAAVILSAGLGHGPGSLSEAAERAARANGLRIVGPNCLGIIVPGQKLNASFAASSPGPGDLAVISQSGAIAAGLIEWAASRSVGFSAVVSIGDQLDVDFGDLLDYFALDRGTRAILLYIESIKDARKFMSAARAAARTKPVIVVKAGRHARAAVAAKTHTGSLAGADSVYDAAFRRAGLLRVSDLDELFAATETLGHVKYLGGKRLAILTNGGGIGVLAVDRLMDLGNTGDVLASIGPEAMARLNAALPAIWSRANPVDIAGDADATRYAAALDALLADEANDAVMVMNVATALASPTDAAAAVAESFRSYKNSAVSPKPIFAVWVGDRGEASKKFEAAGIPHYPSETNAVAGYGHLVRHREALEMLMQMPPSLPENFVPDVATARRVIAGVLGARRSWLDPVEAEKLLRAYSIPIAPVVPASNPEEAADAAMPFLNNAQLVALKIYSPDIIHKSDVGGVRLNLASASDVRQAAAEMLERVHAANPAARLWGVTVHPMIVRPMARELIAGIADDPTFGPVVVFGRGGTAVEVINDKALALPPLDLKLAQELISQTRVSRVLKAYRNVPAADEVAVALILVKLAQLAADVPEIREVDLNPLMSDHSGAIVVDARIAVAPLEQAGRRFPGHPRFAIRPYPKEWERSCHLPNGTAVLVRPVRPEDERLYAAFFARVTPDDLRLRFFTLIKEFSHTFIARMTQLDYARAMAFIALDQASGDLLAVARLHANADYDKVEYAILVRSDMKGLGLGWLLMQTLLEYARSEGLRRIEGQVLKDNTTMLKMCRELGFTVMGDPHDSGSCLVSLDIKPTIPAQLQQPDC
ncbi:MAG TPA: bifunctional acetate--CoA ligase family protein/GNAT family N-acetyltransferase [Pseudolabrys sp.]|jgi:acetyltransferase